MRSAYISNHLELLVIKYIAHYSSVLQMWFFPAFGLQVSVQTIELCMTEKLQG
jgi:hypothetical protein